MTRTTSQCPNCMRLYEQGRKDERTRNETATLRGHLFCALSGAVIGAVVTQSLIQVMILTYL